MKYSSEAYISSQNGHTETVRLLAELGANVNTPDNDGDTPVYVAAQEGHTETLQVLNYDRHSRQVHSHTVIPH